MLTEKIKALIEKEAQLNPRLTGVFFRKHLGQSMCSEDGLLTDLAVSCFEYFNHLKNDLKQKAHRASLQKQKQEHERLQASVKRVNQSVIKSANQANARFIGSLRFSLQAGNLIIKTVSRSMPNPARSIRRYLKKLGVNHLGKTQQERDGVTYVEFTNEAVNNILDVLKEKQATNETVPTSADIHLLPVAHYVEPQCSNTSLIFQPLAA